jgi:hypothetical protein
MRKNKKNNLQLLFFANRVSQDNSSPRLICKRDPGKHENQPAVHGGLDGPRFKKINAKIL